MGPILICDKIYSQALNPGELAALRRYHSLSQRQIKKLIRPDLLDHACLFYSKHLPHCHRRLVAEYLDAECGGIKTNHFV